MKKIITLSVLIAFGFYSKLAACDCIFIPTFCESITFNNNGQIWDNLSVHRITVDAILTNGVKVTVHQTFTGDNLVGHQLTIMDGSGADCILFASNNLEAGNEYIIASSGDSQSIILGECGVFFLKIENGMVTGAISPGISSVPLADFPSIANCGDLTPAAVVDPGVIGGLVVRPTLVTQEVEIRTKSFSQLSDLKLRVYDLAGKLIYQNDYPNFGFYSQIIVDMKDWSAGMYFLQLEAAGEKLIKKLLKVQAD